MDVLVQFPLRDIHKKEHLLPVLKDLSGRYIVEYVAFELSPTGKGALLRLVSGRVVSVPFGHLAVVLHKGSWVLTVPFWASRRLSLK